MLPTCLAMDLHLFFLLKFFAYFFFQLTLDSVYILLVGFEYDCHGNGKFHEFYLHHIWLVGFDLECERWLEIEFHDVYYPTSRLILDYMGSFKTD